MDRLQEKNNLFMKLGVLFGPMIRLAENPNDYDEQERAETIARYCAEYPKLTREFIIFAQGQPGHDYAIELERYGNALNGVATNLIHSLKELSELVPEQLAKAQAALAAIPVPRDTVILEAGTPFTSYCVLKDLCEADTTKNLVWIDAYMDSSLFHRFLRGVSQDASVTLVTSEPNANVGNRNRTRWTEFLDTSRMYAQEQGADKYRLIVHQSLLHDRWLLLDDKRLYSFGGSAKDAGSKQYFTIARVDSSLANLQTIQAHIDSGVEFFGPNTLTHA